LLFARAVALRLSVLAVLIAIPVVPGIFGVVAAQALTFETASHFAGILAPTPPPAKESEFPEDVQLGGVGGMAVNVSGAGGVAPGTVYVATRESALRVARYEPSGDTLSFSERWVVRPTAGPYERCGPALGTACPPQPEVGVGAVDVEVDQTTGDVIVFSAENLAAGDPTVTVFTPDGSEVLARFGELAPGGVTTMETPEKVHDSPSPSGLAADDSGTVYLFDVNSSDNFYHRLMTFKETTPGQPATYKYVNGGDIGAGFLGESRYLSLPVTDVKGDIYAAGAGGTYIQMYEAGQPAAACEFTFTKGGITAMTVNRSTGEVFFFSSKDKRVHQLSPCDAGGEFTELGSLAVAPQRDDLYALAFDPSRRLEPARSVGVLYGGAPRAEPDTGGKGEPGMGALGYIFAPVVELEPVVGAEAVSAVGPTSAQLEAEINPKGPETSYHFQYLSEQAYAVNTHHPVVVVKATGGKFKLSFGGETSGLLPFNAGAAEVEAALAALASVGPGNASVSGGPGDGSGSSPYQIDLAPSIGGELPLLVADGSGLTGADAAAEVGGFFAGAVEAPAGGSVLGSGQEPLHAAAGLSGLLPDTAYRYRAVATSNCSSGEPSKLCEGIGAAQGFHTYPVAVAGPPDARSYELVSPSDKQGGQVLPAEPNVTSCVPVECKPGDGYTHFPMQSSPDGNAVVYEGTPFSAKGAAVSENEYLARRTASGWSSVNLTPPLLLSKGGRGYQVFDADLGEGLLEQPQPSLGTEAPPEITNLYRQPTASPPTLDPLLTNANSFVHRVAGNGADSMKLSYAGGSADLSRLFFSANDSLTSETGEAGEKTNLYEWRAGTLHQVNLAPGSGAPLPGAVFGSGDLLKSGDFNITVPVFTHAISEDGSRAFWTGEDGKTYVRVGATETLEVPGTGSCKESVSLALRTCFLTASADGSKLLLSNGQLYGLDEETGAYEPAVDLTAGKGGFRGVAGQSEDLSHLYFVDGEVLTGGEENDQGAKAEAGKLNLYAWTGGATSYVATLLPADNESRGDWRAAPTIRTAEASPGGRYLAFVSTAPLVEGFDNVGPCKVISGTDEFEDGPCKEVFLYDSATGGLLCPSCNPSGAAPLGVSTLRLIKGAPPSLPQPRYLADSGRLFFDSRDSLSYLDTNASVEDVYQYEPQGLGSCGREGGCVSLISAGRGPVDSNFVTMDPSGDNVFFTSLDRLVPSDRDELIDLYDARVGGGIAEPPPPETCVGETCQAPTPVPTEPSPASQGSLGERNSPPPHCKKGQIRRGGHCVKKPKQKSKKSKGRAKKQGGSK
jgi:hypothetical protein